MSKMANLRAMREARYEAAQAAKARAGTAAPPAGKQPTARTRATAAGAAPVEAAATGPAADQGAAGSEARCGHRNMSGRTCTREKGHAAKTHRYS